MSMQINPPQPAAKPAVQKKNRLPKSEPVQEPPVNLRSPENSQMMATAFTFLDAASKALPSYDLNLDKTVTADEIQQKIPGNSRPDKALHAKLQQYHALLDTDKNGLTEKDLQQFRRQIIDLTPTVQQIALLPLEEPKLVELPLRHMPPPVPFKLTPKAETATVGFEGRDAHAIIQDEQPSWIHTLQVGEQSMMIIESQEPPTAKTLPSLEDVTEAIAALPQELRQHLTSVVLNPLPYQFAIKPENLSCTGDDCSHHHDADMTASKEGLVTIYPSEARSVPGIYKTLLHELGHVAAFQAWGYETEQPGWQSWIQAMKSDPVSPSKYAHENASALGYEDFAESVSLYFQTRGLPAQQELKQLYPARMAVLEKMFP